MKLNELPQISPAKITALKERIQRLKINLTDIEEQFIRGSGKGGQKINKTANCVRLNYSKLNIEVKTQKDRRRSINRFLALRELVDRIEMRVSPQTSQRLAEFEKLRRRKAKRRQRADAKYNQ
ncbi:peptide chain release factor-like protein [Candidatus Desantisbacteria bacterium CG_4_10_14_0_8_um_filter_48_22]|uniref:Peptide chain release factor-like protein n=1 Tax=Candidatus Desantisbacteria bacterium CG_4_10_14_0_8_um_filter_48_22 TaxID=1974543 RepID=A0A2M7SAG3_9BACT|nr:MAG: hypothetical protein AUJ67_06835 [Candidatus Desantisbacteria bacterium CG1_02_49_89]PIV56353.1 MAG: peptide chain release factor-like protein [Candidatus Desantisbacteria bacterium CG02_land_8_20_14_3_00_49_13]PIZ16526.1 MAG: peptide chain release factor-like protein [Candidatus Desantisbacteria bacterium CG_4_10_14_0_8_um_filter_48_22]PJB28505.1 MAG: peptide chain release factor-like protein [Candidatus Desantisbacteria bacterium CG_4_9_14_3_um_filter_50_7]